LYWPEPHCTGAYAEVVGIIDATHTTKIATATAAVEVRMAVHRVACSTDVVWSHSGGKKHAHNRERRQSQQPQPPDNN